MINFGIVELYCGASGKKGFYNNQEVGLARAMKKLGYSCYIFYPRKNTRNISEELVEENITIVYCPAKTIGAHSRYDWNILKKYQIQLAQIGSDNQIFSPNVLKFCDKNNIPCYNYIGTVETDSTNKIKKSILRLLYNRNIVQYRSHMNFAKTVHVQKELFSLGVKRVGLIPVGLDTSIIPNINGTIDDIKKKCGISSNNRILLYVGRIDTYKHPEKMLKVISDLPNYYGIVIGDGLLSEAFEKLINDLNIESRLTWIKKLPNQEVQKYYYIADYFLNFNEKEIFGMSILEAMYQGCNVIALHAPGPDSIIIDQVTGFLVGNLDTMEDIINNDRKLDSQEIKKHIKDNFTWDYSATQIDNWFKGKET